MQRFIANRIGQAIFTLWALATVVFFSVDLTGDPALFLLPPDAPPGELERLRHSLGLDRPVHVRYGIFLTNVVRGRFGKSITTRQEARDVLFERIPATLQLAAAGMALAVIMGIPLGILSAVRKDSIFDNIGKLFAVLGQSAPQFWVAILLIIFLGAVPAENGFELFPTYGSGGIEHLILPAFALGWFIMAGMMRLTRSAMLEGLDSEYIKFARAKGFNERMVIWKHALKNAIIPVLTFAGLALGGLLNGSVVVEVVFAWPGIGRLMLDGVRERNFPVVEATVLTAGFFYVVMALIIDILYAYVDPRIRIN